MFDCEFTYQNGVAVVIKFRDSAGNWIDVATGRTLDYLPGTTALKLSDETLAEYVAECFRLINLEREKEGLEPLTRDGTLDEAAAIRAAEVDVVDRSGGEAHTRPDGASFTELLDEMGVEGRRCGENIARMEGSPRYAVDAWMRSDGHRKNILWENYGNTGIGVCQLADGSLNWVQIFELK
jgi:uncharacterized protein YkwD